VGQLRFAPFPRSAFHRSHTKGELEFFSQDAMMALLSGANVPSDRMHGHVSDRAKSVSDAESNAHDKGILPYGYTRLSSRHMDFTASGYRLTDPVDFET